MKNNKFHLVEIRNIPIVSSILINASLISLPKRIKIFNLKIFRISILISSRIILIWSLKVKKENMNGKHSKKNINLLKIRFILFISSEVLLFISLFWIYLNNSLSPNFETGNIWPPKNINLTNPTIIPIYGTILLIYSGILITWSHHSLNKNLFFKRKDNLIKCIMIGCLFLDIQISEYSFSNIINFIINDSNYCNRFFFITCIHGSHVLIGVIILFTSLKFLINKSMSIKRNSRFEISAWYWHFVDLVWLFVFTLIYWINFFLYNKI